MATTLTAPAESSPVSTETAYLPSRDERVAALKAGKPAIEQVKETPAAVEKTVEKTAPASEPGIDSQEKKKSAAALRLEELLDDMKREGITPNEIKEFRKHYQRKQEMTEPVKTEPEPTAKPVIDPKAPVKPKASDFEGKPWEEYEAARDKYFEELADYKATTAIEARDARNKQEATTKELNTRIEALSKQYGADAREPIQSAAKQIFEDPKVNGIVKDMVNGSSVLVDLLYTLGGDEAGLADFLADAKANPGAAIRKFVLLEKLVQEELSKGSTETGKERDETGKFLPPEKKTAAPKPPTEVSGRGAPPPDEVESATQAALKGGDAGPALEAMRRARIRRLQGK